MLDFKNDDYLYKFTTLNKNIIDALFENKLWHAKVETLNDPFEFYFHFIKELPEPATPFVNITDKVELCENILSKINEFEDELKAKMKNICVCCLSKAVYEPLMWSHYSNGMRGICLVYDQKKLTDSSLGFEEVKHKDTPPRIDFFQFYKDRDKENKDREDLGQCILTKHTGWKYEKEYRSFKYPSPGDIKEKGFLAQLNEGTLKAIIVGSKSSTADKSLLKVLAEKLNFELFIAKANNEEYKVDIKGF